MFIHFCNLFLKLFQKDKLNPITQNENIKTLLLKVQLEKPDIILVESLNDINTNAIIMNVIIL